MLIRLLASGQELDMFETAALAKIEAGMAVRVEPKRETAAINRAIETGARVLKETFRKPTGAPGTPTRQKPNQVVKDIAHDAEVFGTAPRKRGNIISLDD